MEKLNQNEICQKCEYAQTVAKKHNKVVTPENCDLYRDKMCPTLQKCETCWWHDDFSWACFNGESPNCADFTDPKNRCHAWEKKEASQNQGY